MPTSNKITAFGVLTLPATGNITVDTGTFSLPGAPTDGYTDYVMIGSPTLTANVNILPTGSSYTGLYMRLHNVAAPVLSGFTLSIFGVAVPTNLADMSYTAHCICTDNKGAWRVSLVPSWEVSDSPGIVTSAHLDTGAVGTTALEDDAVTDAKIASGAVGDTLVWDAAGNPGKANLGDGALLIGDTALGAQSQAMSGDATIDKAGTITLGAGAVTGDKIGAATVAADKLTPNAARYTRDITLSFGTVAEIGNVNFTMCQDVELESIVVTVLAPPATDDATLIFKDHGGAVITSSQIDVTTALSLGNKVTSSPTANNTWAAGENLLIEMTKTTAESCKVNIALCLKKV